MSLTPVAFEEWFLYALSLVKGEKCLDGTEWVIEVGQGKLWDETVMFNCVKVRRYR